MNYEQPHRRYNPLTGTHVLVSPHRGKRPWQGSREQPDRETVPAYDANCYLCPGNSRVGGAVNPEYKGPFVFKNDFPALLSDPGELPSEPGSLLRAESVRGTCRVICYSPRHDLTLAQLSQAEVRGVVDTWVAETETLLAQYRWVQVFENRGAAMGCSNPHPHNQIWALDALPTEVAREDACQRAHMAERGRPLLGDYLAEESDERLVYENET